MKKGTHVSINFIIVLLGLFFLFTPLSINAAESAPEGKVGAGFGSSDDDDSDVTIISSYESAKSSNSVFASENVVSIGNSAYYDTERDLYLYDTEIGTVECSVCDGMIVTDSVTVTSANSSALIIYKDGERLSQSDANLYEDSGYYVVQYNDNDGITKSILSFTIIPSVTGMIDEYDLPESFRATRITLNDNEITLTSDIDLKKEGEYHIVYELRQTQTTYTLDVTIDHTAPTLLLEAVNDGVAKGPVDISDVESGATIEILMDGKSYSYRDELTESGSYEITVSDAAGNESTYTFTIEVYLDNSAFAVIFIILALIIGVVVYMVLERKRLRVR